MGTTAEKLQAALNSRVAVKEALENKGLEVPEQFSAYAGLIDELENTSDATATEETIMEGETAYTAEGKVTGKAEPGIPIVTTEGDGAEYTATVPLLTELKAGKKITIIPHVTSTTANAKLNVNGFGAKFIRQSLSTNTGATAHGYTDGWILKGKPVTLMYNGTYWISDITRPDANTIYGTTKVENGGTGAATVEAAQANLGIKCNNNMLINSNFANPVNQREFSQETVTEVETYKYTVDRWYITRPTGESCPKLTLGNGYVTLSGTKSNGNGCVSLAQKVEHMPNGSYTVSAKVNEKVYSASFDYQGTATVQWHEDGVCLGLLSSKGAYVTINIDTIASANIEWVKLEAGSVATPYVARLYGEELELCKRYYQQVIIPLALINDVAANGYLPAFYKLPVDMRATPTAKISQIMNSSFADCGGTVSYVHYERGAITSIMYSKALTKGNYGCLLALDAEL